MLAGDHANKNVQHVASMRAISNLLCTITSDQTFEHEPAAAVHDVHNANDQQESPATQGEWLQREFQARSAWAEPAFRCSQALLQSGPF